VKKLQESVGRAKLELDRKEAQKDDAKRETEKAQDEIEQLREEVELAKRSAVKTEQRLRETKGEVERLKEREEVLIAKMRQARVRIPEEGKNSNHQMYESKKDNEDIGEEQQYSQDLQRQLGEEQTRCLDLERRVKLLEAQLEAEKLKSANIFDPSSNKKGPSNLAQGSESAVRSRRSVNAPAVETRLREEVRNLKKRLKSLTERNASQGRQIDDMNETLQKKEEKIDSLIRDRDVLQDRIRKGQTEDGGYRLGGRKGMERATEIAEANRKIFELESIIEDQRQRLEVELKQEVFIPQFEFV